MSVEVAWRAMVTAALIGTDRRAPDVPAVSGPVGEQLAATASGGAPAERLLDGAAVLTVYRRAGVSPLQDVPPPGTAPAEDRPEVPGAAARRLAVLLRGDRYAPTLSSSHHRVDLLSEWLDHATAGGLRAPAELLPELLDRARAERALRARAAVVGGQRARWLAAQNSDWRFVTVPSGDEAVDHPEAWTEGNTAARVGYLDALRRRDPDAARELLTETWKKEAAADRARFLEVFEAGLSLADEEFCERALTDRSGQVREVAAELLAVLPGSALQSRMADRARALVSYDGTGLTLSAPAECDAGMSRDGLRPTPPSGGERAWWLFEIVTRTPLRTWTDAFGLDPAGIVALPVNDQYASAWRRGLVAAAVAQRAPEWAPALIADDQTFAQKRGAPDYRTPDRLFGLLPAEDLVRHAVDMLRDRVPWRQAALEHCRTPWPDDLVVAAFDNLHRASRDLEKSQYEQRWLADLAAARMPHHAVPPRRISSLIRGSHALIDAVSHVLKLRADLAKEFE